MSGDARMSGNSVVQERTYRAKAGCPFCGLIESGSVFSDFGASVSLVPLNPVTAGHLLVIPKFHAAKLWEVPAAELAETIKDVSFVAATTGLDCNIIQSNGSDATQTVPHVHFHVVPRRKGDGLTLPWTGQKVTA